jgi:hypothetical protein
MSLLSRLFSKSSDDFLARGESLFSARRFFEATGVLDAMISGGMLSEQALMLR